MISQLILFATTALTISASPQPEPADFVPVLYPRYPYAGGGWALSSESCPEGTQYDNYINICCPNSLPEQGIVGTPERACFPPCMYLCSISLVLTILSLNILHLYNKVTYNILERSHTFQEKKSIRKT